VEAGTRKGPGPNEVGSRGNDSPEEKCFPKSHSKHRFLCASRRCETCILLAHPQVRKPCMLKHGRAGFTGETQKKKNLASFRTYVLMIARGRYSLNQSGSMKEGFKPSKMLMYPGIFLPMTLASVS